MSMLENSLGWLSSAILLLTLLGQVRQQWLADNVQGVSPWLFFGQVLASLGFIIYSVLVALISFHLQLCVS